MVFENNYNLYYNNLLFMIKIIHLILKIYSKIQIYVYIYMHKCDCNDNIIFFRLFSIILNFMINYHQNLIRKKRNVNFYLFYIGYIYKYTGSCELILSFLFNTFKRQLIIIKLSRVVVGLVTTHH